MTQAKAKPVKAKANVVKAKPKRVPKPNGRPSTFDAAKAKIICEMIVDGMSLRKACLDVNIPPSTFLRWCDDHPELGEQYAKHRRLQAELLAAELLEIADDKTNDVIVTEDGRMIANTEFISRSRLRVDTRKWILSKMLPKIYGDKIAIGGADDLPAIQSNVTLDAAEAYKRLIGGGS